MRCREFFIAALISISSLQVTLAAAADQRLSLLRQLHAQLKQIHTSSAQKPEGDLRRSDLTPLIGAHRQQLTSILGKPDFCVMPASEICSQSKHWAYFFYRFKPWSVQAISPGTVAVTINPGWGSWAVEVDFSKQGIVDAASWVKQE